MKNGARIMSRTKEVDPESNDIPNYKSQPSRIVHSLRKGYNNLRAKLKGTRDEIKHYQIKIRDLQKSRDKWKQDTKTNEAEVKKFKREIEILRRENEKLKGDKDEKIIELKKK
jgi:chromosome segregation ATPase